MELRAMELCIEKIGIYMCGVMFLTLEKKFFGLSYFYPGYTIFIKCLHFGRK